jgi:hypothetical protein
VPNPPSRVDAAQQTPALTWGDEVLTGEVGTTGQPRSTAGGSHGHRFPTSFTRGRPWLTRYNRSIRTVRFPVNARERERSQDIRMGSEIARTLQGVAGSNPVIPTRESLLRCGCPRWPGGVLRTS